MDSTCLRIIWIRHAPVRGQDGILYGQNDVPCSFDGQAETLEKLNGAIPVDAQWYCTPVSRTLETAQAIRPTAKPLADPAFLEQHFGDWQGRRYDALWNASSNQEYRSFWQDPAQNRPPNGESYAQMRQRVADGLRALCKRHPRGTIVIIAHGGSIRCALEEALGSPIGLGLKIKIDPLSLTEMTQTTDNAGQAHWLIDRVNQRL